MTVPAITVRGVTSTGHSLVADVALDFGDPGAIVSVRGFRVYAPGDGRYHLGYPRTKGLDGTFIDSLHVSRSLAQRVIDAIVDTAQRRGLAEPIGGRVNLSVDAAPRPTATPARLRASLSQIGFPESES
jgi:hypothetical protein